VCAKEENQAGRAGTGGGVAGVEGWHEVEKRLHEAEQAAEKAAKRTTKAKR